MASVYQCLLLGDDGGRQAQLRDALGARLADLGLDRDAIRFLVTDEADQISPRAPSMAVFFGSPDQTRDMPLIARLIDDSSVIVPVVSSLQRVTQELPPQLRHINALEVDGSGQGLERLSGLILEIFRLLRAERRLFISYRRLDAQPFAERIYDALDARGFDVFLDVRSVPPAVDFQSELWHRMSDSDVIILIDTPGFRKSRWTTAELARANATNIQILHLLWPGQQEDAESAFSHFSRLSRGDFWGGILGKGRWVRRSAIARICNEAEKLRARAIASRYRYLVDNFCDAARDLGLDPSVQPTQWISIGGLRQGKSLAVVPAVGVPTANRIHEIFGAIEALQNRDIWVIYDNRGILDTWLEHLDWLDHHLPIRTVRMSRAPDLLREVAP